MTRREWARETVEKLYLHVGFEGRIPYPHVEALLKRERARARRVVRQLQKDFHQNNAYQRVCDELLRRLT